MGSTWVKLHDNFATNLKVIAAGEDAAWLYVCGLLFCSSNETDGRIPTAALRTLTAKRDAKTLARILVREGLWVETAKGWEIHDYLKVQRSKAQIEAEREKTRNRKARSRSSHAVTPPVTDGVTDGDVTPPETETETDLNPPNPAARGTFAAHTGQHSNCRACHTNPRALGTNPRGEPPTPVRLRPVTDILAAQPAALEQQDSLMLARQAREALHPTPQANGSHE